MTLPDSDILVIGAGLQGAGVALELARRGARVTLLDQDEQPLNRASLRNEGKIHLGFIYANDASRATAFLQLEGALRFGPIVRSWLGDDTRWLSRSSAFHYLVAADSIVAADRLAEHYAAVEARAQSRLAEDRTLDYLGTRPKRLWGPLTDRDLDARFDRSRIAAGFTTVERAIDTAMLARAMRHAIADAPRITFVPSHTVRTLVERSDGFELTGDGCEGPWRARARQVVNATWERRAALDAQLGLTPPQHLLHRLKYRLLGRLPLDLHGAPSVSLVLGRYGDVVVREDATAYLSWYPAGLRGWCHEVEPPAAWNAPCRGEVSSDDGRLIGDALREGIAGWYRGMDRLEPTLVDAGAIVAIGRSDVDDASSSLHDRTRIGVTSRGGYHSADPGKLTTAPMFAVDVADRVEAHRSGVRAAS